MKKHLALFVLSLCCIWSVAQTVTLSFTGRYEGNMQLQHLPLSRVVVENLSRNWQQTVFFPDTVLTMGLVGVADYEVSEGLVLHQNNPNPFDGTTYVTLITEYCDDVVLELADLNGRIIERQNFALLQPGAHQFRVQLADVGIGILTARQNGMTSSVKMMNKGTSSNNKIDFIETQNVETLQFKNIAVDENYAFVIGDEMVYTGYAMFNGSEIQSFPIYRSQYMSEDFVLSFSMTVNNNGRPCPGAATVTDHEGNVYHTVQIGAQCWMKENLRTTTSPSTGTYLVNNIQDQYSYSGKMAKWYNNDSITCASQGLGLLYNWNAAMDTFNTAYSSDELSISTQSADAFRGDCRTVRRGVCPQGWHLPKESEWEDLIRYVRTQNQNVYNCDCYSYAKAYASVSGWQESNVPCSPGSNPSTNNSTGFTAVPIGGYGVYFWCVTPTGGVFSPLFFFRNYTPCSDVVNFEKSNMCSVRCLRDVAIANVLTAAVISVTPTTAVCGGNVTTIDTSSVIACGVCWSTSPTPTLSDDYTIDGSSSGVYPYDGNFQLSFISALTELSEGTTYYVRAYATTKEGTSYGNQMRFTTMARNNDNQPCPDHPTVTDYDGNLYNTVQIGAQCWMRENLKTTHYSNGVDIRLGSEPSCEEAYRYYPYVDSGNVDVYGYLYNWSAVMNGAASSETNPSGVQGVCPNGWHVPSKAEWSQLIEYVSSQPMYVCDYNSLNIAKSLASTTDWDSMDNFGCAVGCNPSTNNATGFSALPAGMIESSKDQRLFANFKSATRLSNGFEYSVLIQHSAGYLNYDSYDVPEASSVRCLRD